VVTTTRRAVYIPHDLPGIGTPWGDVITEVLAGPLSAGALCCLSVKLCPAANRPAYVHHRCDEAVYVLSGPITVTVGERLLAGLESGACVYIPRGLSRSFATDSASARLLIIQTPAEESDAVLAAIAQDTGRDRCGGSHQPGSYQPSARLIQAMGACGVELIVQPERPAASQTAALLDNARITQGH
jgi:uncharacterized RmlC-like cupin family protein